MVLHIFFILAWSAFTFTYRGEGKKNDKAQFDAIMVQPVWEQQRMQFNCDDRNPLIFDQ